jgi:dipeptidyl aminopeptidase/acylaminoacyl peptidase
MAVSTNRVTVKQDDLFKFKFLQNAKVSPDGRSAAYTVSWVETKAEKDPEEHSAIWLLSLENGESRQLTAGTTRDWSPEWSPDGKQIAFLSSRDEKPQIYLIPTDGGEANALTSLEQGVSGGLAWSPNGKYLAFTAGLEKPAFDPSKPYRVTRPIYRFDALGYVDNAIQDLYLLTIETGETKLLVHNDSVNSNPRWSPDGEEILFSASMQPDSIRFYPILCITNLAGEVRQLTGEDYMVGANAWTVDGKQIVFLASKMELPIGSKSNLWVIDRDGSHCECRTEGLVYQIGGSVQADMPTQMGMGNLVLTEKEIYLNVQTGGIAPIYRIALEGPESWEPVITGERVSISQGIYADRLLFIASDLNSPPDLFSARLNGSAERQLTCLNRDLLSTFSCHR